MLYKQMLSGSRVPLGLGMAWLQHPWCRQLLTPSRVSLVQPGQHLPAGKGVLVPWLLPKTSPYERGACQAGAKCKVKGAQKPFSPSSPLQGLSQGCPRSCGVPAELGGSGRRPAPPFLSPVHHIATI